MSLDRKLEDYPDRVTERVRFSETDQLGHVNNTVFGIYFEIGRTAYFTDNGFYQQDRAALVIVKTEIHFAGMIFWPGKVEIGTRVTGSGRTSFTMDQILQQGDRVVGSAASTMVVIDPATSRPVPISDEVRAILKL